MRSLLFLCWVLVFHLTSFSVGWGQIKSVPPSEFQSIYEENKESGRVAVLDVRTELEFKEGHLLGATNIDFFSTDFDEKLSGLDRSRLYLIYCRSGSRSGKALKKMESLGFQEVYNMTGGIVRWRDEGRPVITDGH